MNTRPDIARHTDDDGADMFRPAGLLVIGPWAMRAPRPKPEPRRRRSKAKQLKFDWTKDTTNDDQ